jgi:hypothetical protein
LVSGIFPLKKVMKESNFVLFLLPFPCIMPVYGEKGVWPPQESGPFLPGVSGWASRGD